MLHPITGNPACSFCGSELRQYRRASTYFQKVWRCPQCTANRTKAALESRARYWSNVRRGREEGLGIIYLDLPEDKRPAPAPRLSPDEIRRLREQLGLSHEGLRQALFDTMSSWTYIHKGATARWERDPEDPWFLRPDLAVQNNLHDLWLMRGYPLKVTVDGSVKLAVLRTPRPLLYGKVIVEIDGQEVSPREGISLHLKGAPGGIVHTARYSGFEVSS